MVGTVHSGVLSAMADARLCWLFNTAAARSISNAGADDATRGMCAPNIFRTSFSNWQPCYPMGKVDGRGGRQSAPSPSRGNTRTCLPSRKAFGKGPGGTVEAELLRSGSRTSSSSPILTPRFAEKKPGRRFCLLAGGGAVKFVKDYAAPGLKENPSCSIGPGFLTDGTLEAQGEAAPRACAPRCITPTISTCPADKTFRANYQKKYNTVPDVYAVQGYDTAVALLAVGLDAAAAT